MHRCMRIMHAWELMCSIACSAYCLSVSLGGHLFVSPLRPPTPTEPRLPGSARAAHVRCVIERSVPAAGRYINNGPRYRSTAARVGIRITVYGAACSSSLPVRPPFVPVCRTHTLHPRTGCSLLSACARASSPSLSLSLSSSLSLSPSTGPLSLTPTLPYRRPRSLHRNANCWSPPPLPLPLRDTGVPDHNLNLPIFFFPFPYLPYGRSVVAISHPFAPPCYLPVARGLFPTACQFESVIPSRTHPSIRRLFLPRHSLLPPIRPAATDRFPIELIDDLDGSSR